VKAGLVSDVMAKVPVVLLDEGVVRVMKISSKQTCICIKNSIGATNKRDEMLTLK
jgi:hypothetical protein